MPPIEDSDFQGQIKIYINIFVHNNKPEYLFRRLQTEITDIQRQNAGTSQSLPGMELYGNSICFQYLCNSNRNHGVHSPGSGYYFFQIHINIRVGSGLQKAVKIPVNTFSSTSEPFIFQPDQGLIKNYSVLFFSESNRNRCFQESLIISTGKIAYIGRTF